MKLFRLQLFVYALGSLFVNSSVATSQATSFTEADFSQLKKFISTYCADCHVDASEGGFGYAGDIVKLSQSKLVVSGSPEKSLLWTRLASGSMPPEEASAQPKEREKKIVYKWIEAGAPTSLGAANDRKSVSVNQMLRAVAKDLEATAQSSRPFIRYLSLRHLHNLSANGSPVFSQEKLDDFRSGMSFFVNSLSWNSQITPLTIVAGTEDSILRVDLRDYTTSAEALRTQGVGFLEPSSSDWSYDQGYGLSPSAWELIAKNEDEVPTYEGDLANAIRKATQSNAPIMRIDSFIDMAGRSHNPNDSRNTERFRYYRVLGIPSNFTELNRALLGGESIPDILRSGRRPVMRSGFNTSGVSDHNRLIERHRVSAYKNPEGGESPFWLSYDFASSIGRQQLDSHPLGPFEAFSALNRAEHVFQQDGGEAIFGLPNGLHAYALFNAANQLLDEGPTEIVRYRDGKHTIIFNGISCMDCHKAGYIEKSDEIREKILGDSFKFTPEELKAAQRLYSADDELLKKTFKNDSLPYLLAKVRAMKVKGGKRPQNKSNGLTNGQASAVVDLNDLYNAEVNVFTAANELDVTVPELLKAIDKDPLLKRTLGVFSGQAGKTLKRETFRDSFKVISQRLTRTKAD